MGDIIWTGFHVEGSRIYARAKFSSSDPHAKGWSIYQPTSNETFVHHVDTEAEAIALAKALAPSHPSSWTLAALHTAAAGKGG